MAVSFFAMVLEDRKGLFEIVNITINWYGMSLSLERKLVFVVCVGVNVLGEN